MGFLQPVPTSPSSRAIFVYSLLMKSRIKPEWAKAPIVDLSGMRVGILSVLEPSGFLYGRAAWLCRCDCGVEKRIASSSLVRGISSSCGCKAKQANSLRSVKDLSGQRFGRLTVECRDGSANRKAVWKCVCDCGGFTHVVGNKLTSGHTTSCGCARKDQPKLGSPENRVDGIVQASKRRARVRGAGGSFTKRQIDELHKKQRGCCANCGAKLGDKFHRDHKVALSAGGTNDIGNIELLCATCNLKKHDKDPIAWAQQNGRLI